MGLRIRALLVSAATTFCSVGALALGLGEIKLNSALNQPLNAEIQLLQVRELTDEQISIGLASRAEFDRLGVERPQFLTDLVFRVDLNAPGGPVVRITSLKPVREPFLDFVINANWPSGKLLREYTLLVDLPVFTGARQQAVEPAPAAPRPPEPTPAERPPSAARPEPAAPEPRAPQPESDGSAEFGPVGANDTLWGIAAQVRPDRSLTVQQTMLAIQRLNPDAFINNNINLLRRGQVLRVPSREEVERLTAQQATQEVASQNRAWSERDRPAASAPQLDGSRVTDGARPEATEPQGRVKLSSPTEAQTGDAGGSGQGEGDGGAALQSQLTVAQEQLDAASRENAELRSRIQAMEEQIETMERLVEVSSDEMRALELAAQRTNEASRELDERLVEESGGEQPPVEEPAGSQTTTEQAESQPERAAQDVVRPAPRAQKTWLDHLLDNVLYIAIGLAALVAALMGWLFLRNRDDGFDDDEFGELPDYEYVEEPVEPHPDETLTQAAALPEADDDRGDETVIDSRPRDADTSNFAEAETEDVVAECDIHIAYGQFDQAEEKLLRALEQEPFNTAVRLKLMEVYATQNDVDRFDQHYGILQQQENVQANQQAERLRAGMDSVTQIDTSRQSAGNLAAATGASALGATQPTRSADLATTLDLSGEALDFDPQDLQTEGYDVTGADEGAASITDSDDFDLDLDYDPPAKAKTAFDADATTAHSAVKLPEEPAPTARSDAEDFEFDFSDEDFDFDKVDRELADLDRDLAVGAEANRGALTDTAASTQSVFEPATGSVRTRSFEPSFNAPPLVEVGEDWAELDETAFDLSEDELSATQTAPTGALAGDDLTIEPRKPDNVSSLDVDFSGLDLDRTLETAAVTDSDLKIIADDEEDFDVASVDYPMGDEFTSESLAATSLRPAVDLAVGSDEALPQDAESEVTQPDGGATYADLGIPAEAAEAEADFSVEDLDLDESVLEDELEAPTLTSRAVDVELQDLEDLHDGSSDMAALDLELDDLAADSSQAAQASEQGSAVVEEVPDTDAPFPRKTLSGWDDIEEADFTELSVEDLQEDDATSGDVTQKFQPVKEDFTADSTAEFEIPDFDPESDDDSDLDFLSDSDETATKLDLARAYMDMGDADGARDILDEVIDEGSQEQKQQAEELLSRLA